MIRKTIACCRPHEFTGFPGALMNGSEVLYASGETEDDANELLTRLMHTYGWTEQKDGRWQCHLHDMQPPTGSYVEMRKG